MMQTLTALLIDTLIGFMGLYVAATSSFAGAVERALLSWNIMTPPAPAVLVQEETSGYTPLPKKTKPETIPRILLDSTAYQQAAVAGAGTRITTAQESSTRVEDALVNIFCTYADEQRTRAVTGSGVFVDSKGVILTNAHVAQFLLIAENRTDARCTIRQGNPARDLYRAELLYISPTWIFENAHLISASKPTGTGERDFALLYVHEAISGELPERFPALPINLIPLKPTDRGISVVAAGYPAEHISREGARADLTPRVASTTIRELFTFDGPMADLLSIRGSNVGEQGSSGGPILANGSLIGLIVTKGDDDDGERSLRALTLPYINRVIEEETGFDLLITLEGNVARRGEIFKQALAPFLSRILEEAWSDS